MQELQSNLPNSHLPKTATLEVLAVNPYMNKKKIDHSPNVAF